MSTNVSTGAARLVWGNPQKQKQKTDNNRQPVFKDGKPVMQTSFGVAIPKAEFGPVWAVMCAEGGKINPAIGRGENVPAFAMKYVDGDTNDANGKPFSQREGYAGCFVIAISSESFPPRCIRLINGAYADVAPGAIKTGDWLRVNLNIDAHGAKPGVATSRSGLYMNPALVEFIGEGDEIFSGVDPNEAFGGVPLALPAGARPIGSAPSVAGAPPLPIVPASAPAPFAAPVAAPAGASPAAPIPAMPGMPPPVPTASPSSPPAIPGAPPVVPAVNFIPAPPVAAPAPLAPVAPVKQEFSVPAVQGGSIPPGYVYVRNSPDGLNWIVTPA